MYGGPTNIDDRNQVDCTFCEAHNDRVSKNIHGEVQAKLDYGKSWCNTGCIPSQSEVVLDISHAFGSVVIHLMYDSDSIGFKPKDEILKANGTRFDTIGGPHPESSISGLDLSCN
jgi:hypothetical protein